MTNQVFRRDKFDFQKKHKSCLPLCQTETRTPPLPRPVMEASNVQSIRQNICTTRLHTVYVCTAHFVSISGVWAVGCIIYLWADTSVSNGAQNKAPLLVKFNQEKLESWAKETLMVPQVHSLGRKCRPSLSFPIQLQANQLTLTMLTSMIILFGRKSKL